MHLTSIELNAASAARLLCYICCLFGIQHLVAFISFCLVAPTRYIRIPTLLILSLQPSSLSVQAQALHTMALLYERPLSLGKEALRLEKAAFKVYRMLLGDKHHLTVSVECLEVI